MKQRWRLLGAAGVISACVAASGACADVINFGQFAPEYSYLPNTISGVTAGGVDFTVTGPGFGFEAVQQGSSWYGDFPTGAALLYDNFTPGAVTLDFARPIASLAGLTLEPNIIGAFTATARFYDGSSLVGVSSFSNSGAGIPGGLPSFEISGAAITSIVLTSTNDDFGMAIGSGPISAVPEPAIWTMMLTGVAMIGLAARRRAASALRAA